MQAVPDVSAVCGFLGCATPEAWLRQAPDHLPELLIDHANCEKKAAGTALSLCCIATSTGPRC